MSDPKQSFVRVQRRAVCGRLSPPVDSKVAPRIVIKVRACVDLDLPGYCSLYRRLLPAMPEDRGRPFPALRLRLHQWRLLNV